MYLRGPWSFTSTASWMSWASAPQLNSAGMPRGTGSSPDRLRPNASSRGFIARVRQSPNDAAAQETNPRCENKRLDRISPNELPGLANRPFDSMLFDVRSYPVESVCRALRQVVDHFRTLANRGRGA